MMGTDFLHPTAALMVWLSSVLAAQSLSYPGLAGLSLLIFLSAPAALRPCLKFIKRARWLLLSLWLILAYGKPGEALGDLIWAPTLEGMAEANLQSVRLLTVLACLAWLFTRLGRDGLLTALWGALRPLTFLGLDIERLLVRLSLVLTHLQNPLPAGEWKRILMLESLPAVQPATLRLSMPRWRLRDTGIVIGVVTGLAWMVFR